MATNKIAFNPEDHAQFVEIRNRLHAEHRLGGSDIGTASGQNKWKSRLRFFNEMTGRVETPDISSKQSIKDGILCEDLVAKKFAERTGKTVHRVNAIQTSDAAPHLFASIDRKVENEDAGLECKTANALNWDAFKGGRLPDSYVKQIKTYMKVTGYPTWYAYVWVMGVAEYCYIYTMDDGLADNPPEWADLVIRVTEMELDECEEVAANWFDKHIIPDVAPECDGSEDESEFLKEIAPEAKTDSVVEIKGVTEEDLARRSEAQAKIKELTAEIAKVEDTIKAEMGEHSTAVIGSRIITWKNNKASSKTDWKAAAAEAGISEEIVARHTEVRPGARVLRIGK